MPNKPLLIRALCNFVEEQTADLLFDVPVVSEGNPAGDLEDEITQHETEPTERTKVKVFDGYLPSKSFTERPQDFPYVLVRPVHISCNNLTGMSKADVVLILGTYAEEDKVEPDDLRLDQAYIDLMNLSDCLLNALGALPFNALDGQFEKLPDLEWDIPDEQPHPFYHAQIMTHWRFLGTRFPFPFAINEGEA